MMRRLLFTMLVGWGLVCVGSGRTGLPDATTFTVDCAEAPDLKDWGDKAKGICEQWCPKICEYLATDGFAPPPSVKLVFKKEMKAPAATSHATININAEYVGKHKEDFGMVVHELTHAVQAYPRNKGVNLDGKPAQMGWLVEGIADYVRFYQYEPQAPRTRIDPKRASYKNGYRVAAAFLAWLVNTHDKDIVKKLNKALRAGQCGDGVFKDITGQELSDLWKEFAATLPAPASKPDAPGEKPAVK